jgi:hypothetical protein
MRLYWILLVLASGYCSSENVLPQKYTAVWSRVEGTPDPHPWMYIAVQPPARSTHHRMNRYVSAEWSHEFCSVPLVPNQMNWMELRSVIIPDRALCYWGSRYTHLHQAHSHVGRRRLLSDPIETERVTRMLYPFSVSVGRLPDESVRVSDTCRPDIPDRLTPELDREWARIESDLDRLEASLRKHKKDLCDELRKRNPYNNSTLPALCL